MELKANQVVLFYLYGGKEVIARVAEDASPDSGVIRLTHVREIKIVPQSGNSNNAEGSLLPLVVGCMHPNIEVEIPYKAIMMDLTAKLSPELNRLYCENVLKLQPST